MVFNVAVILSLSDMVISVPYMDLIQSINVARRSTRNFTPSVCWPIRLNNSLYVGDKAVLKSSSIL